jgi:hypothetical protein
MRAWLGIAVLCSCGTQQTTSGSDASFDAMPVDIGASVLERNYHQSRDGFFVQPMLDRAHAVGMVRDPAFDGTIQGNVYASPLYVDGSPGKIIIATEDNQVSALDESTGKPIWQQTFGTHASRSGAGCGNVAPIGITGTPAIDLAKKTIYFDAATADANGGIGEHSVHAISLDDGTERPGWPVKMSAVTLMGEKFSPPVHNQRSSLSIVGGVVYVSFGGHYGDCGPYRGWLVGIDQNDPTKITGYKTGADRGAGMWAPGGTASDGTSVYVSTGNTFGASTWSGGEAILRFQSGPVFSGAATDYYTPSDWKTLDDGDIDLGGSGPVLVDVPGFDPPQLVIAFGKNGKVYAIDRNNLGGIGAERAQKQVVNGAIINAAAAFGSSAGTFVILHGYRGSQGRDCPNGTSGDLVAVKLSPSDPKIATAWCANNGGEGSPIVTATDASGNGALVWTAGAEGSGLLKAWDAVTGAPVFAGAGTNMTGVRRFTSPIAVKGRIFVAGDNKVFAFK